jgi:predicted  nucleic acid-binding Zn-ribbon protein
MHLPGKHLKIQHEHTVQKLTDHLTQHGVDLDALVPVIEAWDTTLSGYDRSLTKEIDRRETRLQKLEDAHLRILEKQHTNAQAIQLPMFTRRAASLAKRLERSDARKRKLRAGTDTLQEQHDAVRLLLNSMKEYTSKAEAEVTIVRGLIRDNARDMIRSTLATRQEQAPQSTPRVGGAML